MFNTSKISIKSWLIILALPGAHLISLLVLRDHAGPFWLWSNLDPDYWYLLDSLNIVNLDWPRHIFHPGTPLQVWGALLIKTAHPFASSEQITELVIANPEYYLHLISWSLIVINTVALAFLGLCGYLVFGDYLAVVLLQMGPFISKLNIKWMTHVAPEPMLITVVLVLCGVALLALRPGQLDTHRNRYALIFGLIAGFGMALKITSVGIYFLPLVMLWNVRSLAIYGATALFSMVLFTLPAAGSYMDILAHVNNISVGSEQIGEVKKAFIDISRYPSDLIRVSSRPAFFAVLFASLIMLGHLWRRSKNNNVAFPVAGKLLAGLCLADIVQALVVAKHPSGHYMIPVLVLSTLGIVLLYRLLVDQAQASGRNVRNIRLFFLVLFAGLVVAQSKTMLKLDRQFIQRTATATQLDDARFDQCARIYFWSAASKSFALALGNDMVSNVFSDALAKSRPQNDFWFEVIDKQFRDWQGPRDIREIASAYPCIYARGYYPGNIKPTLDALLPAHKFETSCTPEPRDETVFTSGVDCQGKRLSPAN